MIGGGLQRALCLAVGVPAALAYTATIDNSTAPNPQNVCSGYKARDVTNTTTGMTAELHLAGPACNVFGDDISILELSVEYQDTHRLLVNIEPKSMVSGGLSLFHFSFVMTKSPTTRRAAKSRGTSCQTVSSRYPADRAPCRRQTWSSNGATRPTSGLKFRDSPPKRSSSAPGTPR